VTSAWLLSPDPRRKVVASSRRKYLGLKRRRVIRTVSENRCSGFIGPLPNKQLVVTILISPPASSPTMQGRKEIEINVSIDPQSSEIEVFKNRKGEGKKENEGMLEGRFELETYG
jgi:hypothetical protein